MLIRRTAVSVLLLALLSSAQQGESRAPGEKPVLWQLVERAVEVGGREQLTTTVLEHMASLLSRRGEVAGRIERVERALTQPWTPPALAAELRDLLAAPATASSPRFQDLWAPAAEYLDLTLPNADEDEQLAVLDGDLETLANPDLVELELLEALSVFMDHAHAAMEACLSELSDGDADLLFATHTDFREAWYRGHFPDEETTGEHQETLADWTHLLQRAKHDRAKGLAVAARLARLGDRDLRESLRDRLRTLKGRAKVDGFSGDVIAVVGDSPRNRVVLGGKRKTKYEGFAALVIDLGGDDRYERAAVVDDPDALVSVVLDLAGKDRYEGDVGPAMAVGGAAMLFDIKGADRYVSRRLGQGAATFGVALLVDEDGDDEYVLEDYGQGHAIAGTALVYDLAGDDSYTAWAYAQGGGLAYGLSALVDAEGDDTYLADLHWPDVYGNSGPEIYHGASQGYCTGIRENEGVAGGVAALLDLGDGEDRYQSGNFSQGGAYYYSFALMYDGGGDDENFGTRYSQGFGVHQAAAVRWDAGGDDQYTCRSVAHTGMAWDEGVGYFLEDGGDDIYRVGGLALGGAAQTGIAVCVDMDGKDEYTSGGQGQGGTGGFEYHDKPSLGVLIDLGGDRDSYSEPKRKDGVSLASEGVGIFVDSKQKTLARALAKLR